MFQILRFFLPVFLPALFLVSWVTGTAYAQEDQGEGEKSPRFFTESLDVRVVNVEVFVTNRSGDPIEGLSRDDFDLRVDGKPMPISNFYSEARGQARESLQELSVERTSESSFQPIEEIQGDPERRAHVVVLIDHSRMRPANRKRTFNALREAIKELDDEDLVAVVGVEGSLVFYSEFLYDREAIGDILDEVQKVSGQLDIVDSERRLIYGELARGQSGGFLARTANPDAGSLIARIQAYAAQEYNRGLQSMNQIERVVGTLAGMPGRKALLYVGEGIPTRPGEGLYVEWRNRFGEGNVDAGAGMRRIDFDNDYTRAVGNYDLTHAIDKTSLIANRAGVTLYAVDAEDSHGGLLRSALTEQGSTSESASVVDANYRATLEATTKATGGKLIRSSGLLAKELAKLTRDFDTFYSLGFSPPENWEPGSSHNIEVKVRGKGHTVRHRTEVRLPEPGEREASATVAALMYQSLGNPLEIKAVAGSEAPREDGTAALPVMLEIPVGNLVLVPQGETHAASVAIFVCVKDKEGNPGKVQKIPFHLNIPNDKVEEAKANSAHYPLPVVLRPGDQQVAISVRDDINGSLSTIRIDVSKFSQSF